uniref:Uncharacterized protein n=1 Tax=Trichogramma kaykai TaxID=54128 RepID=A0ABD2WTP8_9HYME
MKQASHLLNGRAQIVFDLSQVLGHGHQGNIVSEADNLYVASEVEARTASYMTFHRMGPRTDACGTPAVTL